MSAENTEKKKHEKDSKTFVVPAQETLRAEDELHFPEIPGRLRKDVVQN